MLAVNPYYPRRERGEGLILRMDASGPAMLFAEIFCASTRGPGQANYIRSPRVMLANTSTTFQCAVNVTDEYEVPDPPGDFQEIAILGTLPGYILRQTHRNRYIAFEAYTGSDAEMFHAFACREIARVNRAYACLTPRNWPISVSNIVYVSAAPYVEMRAVWQKNLPVHESGSAPTLTDEQLVRRWLSLVLRTAQGGERLLERLLKAEQRDDTMASCLFFIAEETYPSYYKAYEVMARAVGGHHALRKLPFVSANDLSRFTSGAQSYRHANKEASPSDMNASEAKLFIVDLLLAYGAWTRKLPD